MYLVGLGGGCTDQGLRNTTQISLLTRAAHYMRWRFPASEVPGGRGSGGGASTSLAGHPLHVRFSLLWLYSTEEGRRGEYERFEVEMYVPV